MTRPPAPDRPTSATPVHPMSDASDAPARDWADGPAEGLIEGPAEGPAGAQGGRPTSNRAPARSQGRSQVPSQDRSQVRCQGRSQDGAATADDPAAAPSATSGRAVVLLTVGALALWAAVIAVGRAWGLHLMDEGRNIVLFTPPVLGGYRPSPPPGLWGAAAVAVVLIGALPVLARRLRWWAAVAIGAVAAIVWWVALALIDGLAGLTRGLEWKADFEAVLPGFADDPGGFLSGFTSSIKGYSIQIRGHPPGLPLVLTAMHRIGLRGPGWAAALCLLSAALGVVAVLVTVRRVAGEARARQAIPFLALAPAAIWIGVSFDALYIGPAAWCVALLVMALDTPGRRSAAFAVAGGVLAAVTAMLSYGLVLVACIPVAVACARHRWKPLVIGAATAVAVVLAFVPLGFWWFAGLKATHEEYYVLDLDRPYWFFLVNNVAAWALCLGPATFVALGRLRDRRLWLLVGGGLAAVALAGLSGLSMGEVERIWLPFTLWVLPAGAVLFTRRRATTAWLAVQAATALLLTALISTNW